MPLQALRHLTSDTWCSHCCIQSELATISAFKQFFSMVIACSFSSRSRLGTDKTLPSCPTPLAGRGDWMRFAPQPVDPSLWLHHVATLPSHTLDVGGFFLSSPIPPAEHVCLTRLPKVVTLTWLFVECSEFESPQTNSETPGSSKHPEKHDTMRRG